MDIDDKDNRLNLDERVETESENQTNTNKSNANSDLAHLQIEENSASQINKLKDLIRKNLPGCDLVLCIFIAALKSFRADKCLRPFPPHFVNEKNEKDFVLLVSVKYLMISDPQPECITYNFAE